MIVLNKIKYALIATFLLITSNFFSNSIDCNPSISTEKVKLILVTVDPISPTTGHAGTIVTINGTGFTATSTVSLGTTAIPAANIQFVSATELKVTVPCGVASGYFSVSGIASATLFNYLPPTITSTFTNLSYCVGSTVPQIAILGTPATSTTPSGLTFSWTNSNNAIGLISSGVGNIPTFTAVNPTLEPLTSTITITPTINGCLGTPKSYTITVNPRPVVSPISTISVCAGGIVNQINLTASSPNSGTGTSFAWTGTNNAAIGLSTSSGTTSPIPSFTAANTVSTTLSSVFTVTPTFQGCVGAPISFNIDVAPVTLGGTLTGTSPICSGTIASTMSLTGQRGVILNWESSTTGNAPWTTIANTSATYQPVILTQTTYYRVAVQNTGCAVTYSNTFAINVNTLPTITGNLSVCNGGSSTLVGSGTPALNAWQSLNIGIASVTNTGLVTGNSPGTSIITYTNSNGCSITSNFVVNALPSVITRNPAPACSPNTIDLNSSAITTGSTSGLNFSYFTNAAATITLANPNAVASSGTYYIKGTDANGCSNVNSVSVLINSLPTVAIAGNNSVCANQGTSLTATGGSTYTWSSGMGTTASISVNPTTTTTYTVNAVDNNGCTGTASSTVTVKSLPSVSAGANRSLCSGTSLTLAATGSAGNTYTWDNAVTDNVSFVPSATTTYTVTAIGSNGCNNTSAVTVTVNPLPTAPLLNVVQPNCSSNVGTIQFSGLPTSGNWTINPGSYNGTGASYTLNNQIAGTYNYSVRDANSCNSAVNTVIITAAPTIPTAPTTGLISQPSCANATGSVVLSGLPTGNWTLTKLPGSQTYTNTGNTFTVTNLTSGSYTFSVSNGTCSSLASQNVVIDLAPSQSAPIVGVINQPTCAVATGSVILSGLPSGNWTLTRVSDGVTFSNTGSTTTLSGLQSGTYNYTITNQAGCVSALSNAVVINNQPASPVAPIASAQSFLSSANATVSNLQIVSSGSPLWYANAVGGTAIPSSTLLSTGIYYASQVVNSCESTARTSVSVSVFTNSNGGTVLGTTTVCIGTNSTTLTLVGFAGSILNWQSSTVSDFSANVSTINVQSSTYTVTNLSTPLFFRAVVQNGISPIAYSTPGFIDIVAQSVGGTLTTSTAICSGQNSGLLSLSGFTGSIIRWEQSVDNGSTWTTITNINSTYTSGALTTTTQFRAVVQNGVCSSVYSNVVTITVKSTPVVTDFPNQQVCYGSTKIFGDPFVAGYTYAWTSDTGFTSVLPQISITFNQVVTQNYTYTVTNTATGCASQDQFQLVVSPLPNATVISNTTICEGNSLSIGANSNVGSTYSWTSTPSGFLSTNSNPSVTPAVTTTYLMEEMVTATGCKKTNQIVVTVQPIPVITIVGAPQFNICETTTQVQLNASIANQYASFVWTKVIGSGSFDNNTILNPIYSPSLADVTLGSVTLRLSVIGANPCVATYTQDVVIIIDKKPIANAGLDAITCGTNPVQLNATGTLNASSLVWTLPTGITGTLNSSNPYIPVFTPSASDVNYVGPITISLTASSNTACPSTSDTVSVLITPAPVVNAGPPSATICQGSNYTVPVNSATAQNVVNSTILWTKGTGDGTIVGANSLTPTYIPGFNDIQNGTVTLTLSATGNNPCITPSTDSILITIIKNPIVNAGPDTLVCQGSINVNASIQNAGSILWTVQNGNGNFVDPTAISPIYIPAISDLNTTVTFSVTVTPINNCGPTVSDSVLYTINAVPSIVVGGNATICQSNTTYQLQATASNTSTITWTSTGSGAFDNIYNEDPIYTLSPGDVNAGSVTFTLTGTQSGCSNASDQLVLTIQKNPTANAGIAQQICQGDSVTIPGSATNASAYNWIRSGGTGSFLNANTTNPTYNSQLTESGTIYLTMVASAIAPCSVSASSNTTISITPRATADAGNDAQICEGDTYQITTATASNNIGVQWSTNGDGTFTGGNTISPTYTPGPSDNNNGSVVLTLVATKNFPCNANAVDQMTLVINKIPVITVINPDIDMCVGDPFYIVTGVVPSNYDNLTWSSSGTGNFAPNTSAISPTYFPSASDYTLGTVTLTLTASRNPLNCNSSRSNTITLHFIKKPTVDAGPTSAIICEGASYVTNQATAANYSNVTWSTSGTGTFTNATTLLATYTPSAADYNLGFVNLTLTANTITPCTGVVTDVIRLNLQKLPVITLSGISDSICITQNTYAIGGTSVVNYVLNSQIWTTSGTGTFSPSGDPLNPIYNPSVDDLAAGFVSLTITVNSNAPCIVPVSKSLVLNFQKLPVASAGPALTKCDTPFLLNTATADLSTVNNLVWSTSGTGTFDYTNILAPIYTPSAFDVLNSPITLTLTANAIAPCSVPSISTLQLTLVKSPTISVTNQLPICEDITNVTVLGTTISNYSSFVWSSATGTTISNTTILNPIVTPSLQDIINNQIVLTITAQPNAPCGSPVSKTIIILIQKKPIVRAGNSETICENSIILTSNAFSSDATNLHWSNNGGDGLFTTSNLNTITEYTPGAAEIASGQVLLTLIGDAIAPCTGTVSSTVTYSIVKNPIVTVNPTEVTICETQTSYTVPSSYVTLVNPSSILSYQWTTPNMAGLTGAGTWTPTYTPTAGDIATGHVYLTLTVNPIAPCATPIVKTFKINIAKQAAITFTNDGFFCEGLNKPLTASFANHIPSSISWTIINGTGSLTGANTASPTYIPATDSGTVVIRISATSLAPCNNVVFQDFTITIVKKPIVSMTTILDTVCSSQLTYNLAGNTALLANTIQWTRVNPVGTGTFSNSNLLNPVYTFNAADVTNGFVILRLTATSTSNCNLSDYKEIRINITKAPSVVTAPTDTVCQGSVYSASATTADSTSVLWTTVGTSNGLFTNANQLVTQYTPGSNDINSFTIQITANGSAPCAPVTAVKTVTIQNNPILDAGIENRYNCSSLPYQITGVTGQNLGSILWTSNGSVPGTFSNPTGLNPTYTPSASELGAGLPIILTVTAQAVAPCTGFVTDFIVLNLTPNQVVNAGTYPTICEGGIVNLIGSVTNASSFYWTTSGTGTFGSSTSLITTYTPSNADIINTNVTLTLNAVSNTNCPIVSDATQITIIKKPTASAGANVSICEGSSYTLAAGDATAQNYTSLSWTATGPGALNLGSINTLTPTYVPAPGQTGTVNLTLTAVGNSVCGLNAVSQKTITIVPQPFVSTPSSKIICEGSTLVISNTDASATDYSSLQWTSSNGLGTFSSTSTPATIYTPATGQTGTVTLTLTATSPNGVCPTASSPLVLTIIPKPIVEAGTNGTICQTGTFTVSGASVQNASLYSWSLSGPAIIQLGTENTLTPVIVPNAGATGTITATLSATGNGICPVVITDFITIQINPIPVVNAGIDGSICEGTTSFQLNGTASNATNYSWTTTGGGTIQPTSNSLTPVYFPSASDYNTPTGIKVITFNLVATTTNGCSSATDSMQLTLNAKPKVNAGIDLLACQDSSSVLLNGATVSNYNSGYTVSWTSSGNGTWDYTGSNLGINPVYIFGSSDTPSVTLTMSALPIASCPQVPVTDSMVITINQNPTITVSSSTISMCGETFTMPDLVTVNNGNGILWTNTTGTSLPGILTNATSETPIFSPSANEIANGFVLLTVTATPQAGCSVPAVKVIRVNLQPKAVVNAGTNVTVCQGQTITINNGASVQNYATYSWTENGTGTIDPATINTLNPKYLPGIAETGVITLTLQATNLAPCIGSVSQTMTITISPQPTVNAGQDVVICQNSNYSLVTATAANYTSIQWTNSYNIDGSNPASGTFNNTTIINPTYTPSQADINNGYVFLTVKATNSACNTFVTDVIRLTITKGPAVAAGINATICEGSTFNLAAATAQNTLSLAWTSSLNSNGTGISGGSFSSATILNPVYTPSVADINAGHVYLNLSGTGDSNCPFSYSQILLNIVKRPTVSTTDVQMCVNTPSVLLVGNATNYQSLNWSIYSGPGSISLNNPNPLNPTFTSGISSLTSASTTIVRLLVTPNPGCPSTTAVYSDLVITIQPLPSVEAGVNGAVCYTAGQPIDPFTITGTNVTNASSQSWTTNGAGLFSLGTNTIYQSLANICRTDILTLTATGVGACSTTSVSDNVTLAINCTVASLGSISPAISTICQGATATFSVPLNPNILTYNWLVTSGTIVSGQGTNSIQVVFNGTISGNITVTGTNGCGSVAATMPITITTLPTGTSIVGPSTVCAGSSNNVYTANTILNATSYVWTLPNGLPNGSTITTTTNTLTIAFGVSETSGNLSVRGSNGCGLGAVSSAFPVTIVPKPTLSSTLTPSAICSGTLFSYTPTSATTGCTFSWTRAALSGISNPAAGPSSGAINEVLNNTSTSAVSVIYQYTITTPEGCTNTQNVIVTVNPSPSITSSATPAAICSGSTFNYTPTSGSVGAITWTRNLIPGISNPAVVVPSSGAINEVLNNTTASPITVVYNLNVPVTANGCTNATPISLNVVVNPLPVFTVTNPAAVCSPSTVSITTAASGTSGLVYSYWNDSATINLLANPSAMSASGTYYIKATNSYVCSTINPVVVTINPVPVFTVTNPAAVCSPNTVNITNAASIVAGLTYTYWNDSTATVSQTTPSAIAASGTYYIKATNSFNCYTISPVVVTINTSPSLTSNTTPAAICSGSTFNYTPTSLSVGTITWTRNLIPGISNPAVGPSIGTINEALNNTTASPITVVYNLNVPATANGCTNATPLTLNVVVNPLPVFTVTNPAVVCSPSTVDITNVSSGAAGLTYTYWSNTTATISLTNPSAIAATGTYYIKATNTYGCSIINPVVVTINPLLVFTVTNPAAVCSPNTVNITNAASGTVGLIYSYWNDNAATNSLSNPSAISVSGTYYIKATNSFGCSTISQVVVTINPLPVFTVTNLAAVCSPSTVSITNAASGTSGLIYSYWNDSAATNAIVNPNAISASGTYYIKATNSFNCFTINPVVITVNPLPVFTVTNPAPVCSPSTVSITNAASGTAGLTYTYWNDSAATNSLSNPGAIAASGTYYIKAMNSFGCYVVSPVVVIINPLPVFTVTNPAAVCSPNTVNITTAASGTTGLTYTYWNDIAATNGITNPGAIAASGTYYIKATNSFGCYVVSPVIVTINPLPVFTVTNPAAVCSPSTVNITFAASGTAGLTYTYWNDNAATNGIVNPSAIAASGTYYIKATNSFGCSTINPVVLTINPLPVFSVTNPAAVCSPNTVNITNAALGTPGLVYSYWNDSAATNGVINASAIPASGTYFIKATNSFGCSTINPVVVVINPLPTATITGTNNFVVCQNGTQPVVTFTGSNGTAPYTFNYSITGPLGTTPYSVGPTTGNNASVTLPIATAGNYTVTLISVQDSSSSACLSTNITLPNTAYLTVQQVGTIVPTNPAIVSQTVCQGTPITPIVFTISGAATNAYVTGLPNGLNAIYTAGTGTLTISGTPIISTPRVNNYVVYTSGSTNGCNSSFGGTITVNSNDTITALTPTTVNQSVCLNAAIQPIVYNLGGGATGGTVTFNPIPNGITWALSGGNTITISGTSSTTGTFTYTVQSFGICGPSTATGTITINNSATVTLVSGNSSPSVCIGSSFATPIQFGILPSTAGMVLSGSLPNGVTFSPGSGFISGTPTQNGTFPYTISPNTGCGNSVSGVINVNPLQSISFVSGNTNQSACQFSPIDPINFTLSPGVTTVSVNPALPNGITPTIGGGNLTISGTPTVSTSVPSNYIITTQGTCGTQATYSVTLDIRPEATIVFSNLTALNQSVCQSSPIVPITFTIGGGATGVVTSPLQGLTLLNLGGGVYTLQGTPTNVGINNISITTTGCPKTAVIAIANVNSAVGINLTSGVNTDNQTICQSTFNTPITPITYTTTGATNVVVTGLPSGVTAVFSQLTNTLTINGIPTVSGVFNYTITSSPCSIVKTGVIRISTPISITNESVTNVSCSSLNDGAISLTIIGGASFNGQYAILWSGPNGFQQNLTSISGLEAGQYVLTGTDAIGCPIPTRTYTVLPAVPIDITLVSTTNVSCNGNLGIANFNISGGSGIYTFTLQFFDPNLPSLVTIIPPFNNYYNIRNLRAGRYYLTVRDSRNCSTAPFLFNIYDYSSLSIDSIIMDDNMCQNNPGKIRIKVNSLDTNLSFYYNSNLVSATYLGFSMYELLIPSPWPSTSGVIKVINSQNCSVTTTVTTPIVTPNFTFTSSDFRAFGYYSVNGSVQFTNLVTMSNIPPEYAYIVWDFGDNTPFKVFRNPEDLVANAAGENFETVFHTYTTNGIYEVTLTVYNHFGCSRKITKTIVIGTGATMMLPTIFTPNGDGINDLFRPSLLGLKEVSMYIYDGWGNIVYEVSSEVALLSPNWGWNGVEKGQAEPRNNDYRYYIIATTINDKKIEKEGRFLLVK